MNDYDQAQIEDADSYTPFDNCEVHPGIECEGDCPCRCDDCGAEEVFGPDDVE